MYCANCGQAVSGSFCAHCGTPVVSPTLPAPVVPSPVPAPVARLAPDETAWNTTAPSLRARGNSLTWPFHQRQWWSSVWMPLGGYFWLFGFPQLLAMGWSNDAIGRRARGQPDLLPRTADLGTHLKVGLVVLIMGFVYLVLPGVVASWILQVMWWEHLEQVLRLTYDWMTGTAPPNASHSLRYEVLGMLSDASVQFVLGACMIPLFIVARIRYAVTRRASSFFRVFGNIVLSVINLGALLRYFFVGLLLTALEYALNGVLLFTVVGLVVPMLVSGATVWILADLAAPIARSIIERETPRPLEP